MAQVQPASCELCHSNATVIDAPHVPGRNTFMTPFGDVMIADKVDRRPNWS